MDQDNKYNENDMKEILNLSPEEIKPKRDLIPIVSLVLSILLAPIGLILSIFTFYKQKKNPYTLLRDKKLILAAIIISTVLTIGEAYLLFSGKTNQIIKCAEYGEGIYEDNGQIFTCGNVNPDEIISTTTEETSILNGEISGLTDIAIEPQDISVSLHYENNEVSTIDTQITTKYDTTRFNDEQLSELLNSWYSKANIDGVSDVSYDFSEGIISESVTLDLNEVKTSESQSFCEGQCVMSKLFVNNYTSDYSLDSIKNYYKFIGLTELE